jgi:hypothetical protein
MYKLVCQVYEVLQIHMAGVAFFFKNERLLQTLKQILKISHWVTE